MSSSQGGGSSMATSQQHAASGTTSGMLELNGGRFDFDDGGTYCGGWEDGKAHGHGVCTGPKGQGEYSGSWHYGFEVSGVYTWPSGSTFEGHWQNGKRHGLGVEARGRWLYRGEWTQGFKGRYGVRQSTVSNAKYEGTWANGLQDGYGSETYADGGTYQGQWLRGMRHGYGVRTSAPFGMASTLRNGGAATSSENVRGSETSLNAAANAEDAAAPQLRRNLEETRGGFVLRTRSDEVPHRRRSLVERTGMKNFVQGLKLKKQRSTGDLDRKGVSSIRSTGSTTSWMSSESGYTAGGASVMSEGSNQSFFMEDEHLDSSVTETYMGEWKNDKRSGFGISERSDGLRYEGEWFNNRKYGYGVTTFRDGSKEEGKYKNNILITSTNKRHLFLIRSAKFRERIDSAINASQRASKIALQKADIAISRTATARGKAEQADIAALHAKEDGQAAILSAKQYSVEMSPQEQQKQLQQKQQHQQQLLAANNQNSLVAKDKSKSPFPSSFNAPTATNSHAQPHHHPQSDPKSLLAPSGPSNISSPKTTVTATVTCEPPPKVEITSPSSSTMFQKHGPGHQAAPAQGSATAANKVSSPRGAGLADLMSSLASSTAKAPGQAPSAAAQTPTAAAAPLAAATSPTTPKPSLAGATSTLSQRDPETQARFDRLMSRTSVGGVSQQPVQPVQQQQQMLQQSSSSTFNSAPTCDTLDFQSPKHTVQNLSPRSAKLSNATSPYGATTAPSLSQSTTQQYKKSPEPFASSSSAFGASKARGGYNLQQQQQQQHGTVGVGAPPSSELPRTSGMVDHFDHYRRPPSREPSVDRMPNALMEAGGRSSRPASRTRTPHAAGGRSSGLGGASLFTQANTDDALRHGQMNGQNDLRYRGGGQGSGSTAEAGAAANSSISSIGTIPKRTESLYLKPGENSKDGPGSSNSSSSLQRKKSLPDVQSLVGVTSSQGSKEMTREEISVLSSSRRDQMRRQMEEIERYRANPLMYIFNPRVQEWISRQQLMLLVLFVNLSLAFMFFKLLT